ncbi:hypothetical protein KSF78_0002341 [Schistosoma japonicum]|nr:hypothetical protein KSF78_0002341 [Schistosoma japonicum]
MYNLHDNESINTPLDLRLYNRFNKTRRLRIKRGKLKKLPKSKYSFYAHHLKNSSQQFNNCLQTSFKQSDTFNCSICNMETINFNMFIQHMLQADYVTQESTHKTINMVLLDEVKSRQMNQSIEENQSNEVNQIDLYQTSLNCVHLLRSHPVLGLLPHEIASKVDSYKASRICHLCLKEFADEMTVLHHQVEEHSLDDQSNVINSINQ